MGVIAIQRFKSRPVEIDAAVYTGGNFIEIIDWVRAYDGVAVYKTNNTNGQMGLYILTLEGEMLARPGDVIIKGTHGEFYPCKPEVFKVKYERTAKEKN